MIIDLCSPRKKIVNKLLNTKDEILLNVKLHPGRYKNAAFISYMAMFALLHSQGVKADSPKFYDTFIKDHTLTGSQLISSKAELLKYYTTELHYPREYALKILNSMNNSGVEECMKSANGWKQVYQNWDIRFDKVEYVLRFFHIVK